MSSTQTSYRLIPCDSLRTNSKLQPRHRSRDLRLEPLTRSIRREGVIEPLVVRKTPEGLEVVCGHRRLKAAMKAKLTEVPVVVRELNEEEALLVALQENIHRQALDPIEESHAFRSLLDAGVFRTQRELAGRLGISQGRVSQMLRLLAFPSQVQDLMITRVKEGRPYRLSERHARELAPIEDEEVQIRLAQEVCDSELSVTETKRLVDQHASSTRTRSRAPEQIPLPNGILRISTRRLVLEIRAWDLKTRLANLSRAREILRARDRGPTSGPPREPLSVEPVPADESEDPDS